MDVVGVAGAVGLVGVRLQRSWRLPILLLATYLAGAGGGEFLAAVPWALIAGVGFAAIVDLAQRWLAGASASRRRAIAAAVGGGAVPRAHRLARLGRRPLVEASPAAGGPVAAMRWLATNTPADAVVLVPTAEVWGYDEVSEWLPAIAERRQHRHGAGVRVARADGFEAQLAHHERILGCAGHDRRVLRRGRSVGASSSSPRADLRAVLAGRLLPGAARDAGGRGLRDRVRRGGRHDRATARLVLPAPKVLLLGCTPRGQHGRVVRYQAGPGTSQGHHGERPRDGSDPGALRPHRRPGHGEPPW